MASLKATLESALAAHLTSQVGGNVYKGHSAHDKEAPCVICQVESLEEEPLASGNFNATCRIIVKSMASDGEDALDAIDTAVRNAIWNDELSASLTTANLNVWGTAASTRIDFGIEADALTASHTLVVHCCNYTFPA